MNGHSTIRSRAKRGLESAVVRHDLVYVSALAASQMKQISGAELRVTVEEDPSEGDILSLDGPHRPQEGIGKRQRCIESCDSLDRHIGVHQLL